MKSSLGIVKERLRIEQNLNKTHKDYIAKLEKECIRLRGDNSVENTEYVYAKEENSVLIELNNLIRNQQKTINDLSISISELLTGKDFRQNSEATDDVGKGREKVSEKKSL